MQQAVARLLEHPEFLHRGASRTVQLSANQRLFCEGEHCGKLYVIEQGRVRVTTAVPLANERHIQPGIADLGPGEMVGELAMVDGGRHTASVITLTDTRLTEIDSAALLAFLDEHPELGYPMMKALATSLVERMRAANSKVSSLFAWGLKAHRIEQHL
ncbi:MAG: cyclic nucleotide-binding domain-containing protein [Pseudomonadota bacterium]|nr:cyclic nucleotide-binding domain-containing protein [Pseudomonadota bacterium]